MKKCKSILALVLVAALFVTLFAACANNTQTDTNNGQNNTPNTNTDANNPDDGNDSSNTPDGDSGNSEPGSLVFAEGELVDLKMIYFDMRVSGDHAERINAALNGYLEPTYGLHIDVTYMQISDFLTKVQIALSGGERVDLMCALFTNSVSNLYANNMLLPLDDLLEEYAPEALDIMADYVDVYRYNGQLYGFPVMKNWVGNEYIIMRKDILDELELTEFAQNMTTWSEFETILAAVNDSYGGSGMYPISKAASKSIFSACGFLTHGDNFSDVETWDYLGDSASVAYVNNDTVSLYQAQDAFVEEMKMLRRWADNGWVWPDSSLSETHGDELMSQGITFSNIQASEIGIEITKGATVGKELICTKIFTGQLTASAIATWGTGVPVTAEEPEAAVYLLNALYTDPTLMNLITWGVEGEDYTVVDGQVSLIDGGYYECDFVLGNNLLLTPLYGNGADHYENVLNEINNAPLSPYLSFALDKTDLDLAISQLTAVNDQYNATLTCGMYTDEVYTEYINKLEAAGVYDYLGEIQTQLDAWKAAQ